MDRSVSITSTWNEMTFADIQLLFNSDKFFWDSKSVSFFFFTVGKKWEGILLHYSIF